MKQSIKYSGVEALDYYMKNRLNLYPIYSRYNELIQLCQDGKLYIGWNLYICSDRPVFARFYEKKISEFFVSLFISSLEIDCKNIAAIDLWCENNGIYERKANSAFPCIEKISLENPNDFLCITMPLSSLESIAQKDEIDVYPYVLMKHGIYGLYRRHHKYECKTIKEYLDSEKDPVTRTLTAEWREEGTSDLDIWQFLQYS